MKRLPPYIRRHWLGYTFGIFCTLTTASLAMVGPYLLRDAINAIESRDTSGWSQDTRS